VHCLLEKVQRVAAAYLFCGPPDSDKTADALQFAENLGSRKHDLIRVAPDGASIKIEQVRELQSRVRYGPSAGEHLCVLIEPADTLTPEAAAAFLKTLEEPPPRVVFILLVEREDRLPATIVSRCQRVVFGESVRAWQVKAENEPFYAELRRVREKSVGQLLALSTELQKERADERLEPLLYDLAFFAREELQDIRLVRVLLEAVKNCKRKANLKLNLDVACLEMGRK